MDTIKTVDLTKKYKDVVAVDKLNLQIPQGELFALLGVNGAGKTTTIKMLCGLTKPTQGDAFINGKSITASLSAVKGMIGVSPQETAIAPNLTVKENMELMCGIFGLSKENARKKAEEMANKLGLQTVLSRRAGTLSGGWQRRISIALALIGAPSVLFLDEPTLGLDVIARAELWGAIRALKGKITIILTTHYMEEAETLSDRIGIMKDGKLLVVGTAGEMMAQTATDRFENAFIAIVKEASV